MTSVNFIVPVISAICSFVFAVLIFKRWTKKKGSHLLLWAIGIVMYGIGGLCEALNSSIGWSSVVFRLWYMFGAVLVAAWLGQGTMYLLLNRRVAHVLMAILLIASIYGMIRVLTAELDPSLMTGGINEGNELSGHAIVTPGVRTLTPFFNSYGTVALVGGALWSAIIFWRKKIFPHRALGNVLIAVGALFPAFGGAFSRLGIPNLLYIAELLGVILILFGISPCNDAAELKGASTPARNYERFSLRGAFKIFEYIA